MAAATSMSSLVSTVLANAGEAEEASLAEQLGTLQQELDDCRTQVFSALKPRYTELLPSLTASLHLSSRVQDTMGRLEECKADVRRAAEERLAVSRDELREQAAQLEEAEAGLQVLDVLTRAHDLVVHADQDIQTGRLRSAAEQLRDLKRVLEDSSELPGREDMAVFPALRTELSVRRETLMSLLQARWNEAVQWSGGGGIEEEEEGRKAVELKISGDGKAVDSDLADTIIAMHMIDMLGHQLRNFGDALMTRVVEGVVRGGCGGAAVSQLAHSSTLRFTPAAAAAEVDAYKTLQSLADIFKFLHSRLLNVTLVVPEDAEKETGMGVLGEVLGSRVTGLVINDCLARNVPASAALLATYQQVQEAAEALQTVLIECGFLALDHCALQQYSANVFTLFANKRTLELLERARTHMKCDLHTAINVGPDRPFGDLSEDKLPSVAKAELEKQRSGAGEGEGLEEVSEENKLPSDLFKIPESQISESARSLVLLLHATLEEACESAEADATRLLFFCSRNVVELYCDVAPTSHTLALAELPLAAALQHNNALYLAHHLLSLGHIYRAKLESALSGVAVTYVDQVSEVRRVGTEALLGQMRRQKDILLDLLKNTAIVSGAAGGRQKYEGGERAVKQLNYQLQQICRVWGPVLPRQTCLKALGTLLNTVLSELISQICGLEDITAEDATHLAGLLTSLVERAPALMALSGGVEQAPELEALLQRHVRSWVKACELGRVLEANLQDLSDRWAGGAGPLAAHFSAQQVRGLVRALFANSERRARLLAKIKS